MSRKDRAEPFPYAERARAANEARARVAEARELLRKLGHSNPQAVRAWREAINQRKAATPREYSGSLFEALETLGQGSRADLEEVIHFLEADPGFKGSDVLKTIALRRLKYVPLEPDEVERLRRVVLNIVDRRDGSDFRDYCGLARHLMTPGFRREVEARTTSIDSAIARHAEWVISALDASA